MTPYWFLFLLPLIGVLSPWRLAKDLRRLTWLMMGSIAVIAIGLRHEIGSDWDRYLEIYDFIDESGFPTEPGYAAVNWLSARLGWGIYGVNLFCGVLFAVGLGIFCNRQPMPWLAWVIATPFLLIVVAMGTTRQGVALGLVFWGLAYLEDRRVWPFVMLVILGATFHQSAVLLLPLGFLVQKRGHRQKTLGLMLALLSAVLVLVVSYNLFLGYYYYTLYFVGSEFESGGGVLRVWMNALPAAVMLAMSSRWTKRWPDPGHWRWLAWSAIGCVFLVGTASTAVDRVGLYLSPLQLYVWSRFPLLFADRAIRSGVVLGLCLGYATVLWVWLNFAVNAFVFLPYRNILLP